MQYVPYFIVRGLPGSGKSYLAERVVGIEIVDPDRLKIEIDGVSSPANRKYRVNLIEATHFIEVRKPFAWVQCWSKVWGIAHTVEVLEGLQNTETFPYPVVVEVNAPFKEAYRRFKLARDLNGEDVISFDSYCQKYVAGWEEAVVSWNFVHKLNNNYSKTTVAEFQTIFNKYLSLGFSQPRG